MSRSRDEALANLAIDEAPLLREGYRDLSVARIIATIDREHPPDPPLSHRQALAIMRALDDAGWSKFNHAGEEERLAFIRRVLGP